MACGNINPKSRGNDVESCGCLKGGAPQHTSGDDKTATSTCSKHLGLYRAPTKLRLRLRAALRETHDSLVDRFAHGTSCRGFKCHKLLALRTSNVWPLENRTHNLKDKLLKNSVEYVLQGKQVIKPHTICLAGDISYQAAHDMLSRGNKLPSRYTHTFCTWLFDVSFFSRENWESRVSVWNKLGMSLFSRKLTEYKSPRHEPIICGGTYCAVSRCQDSKAGPRIVSQMSHATTNAPPAGQYVVFTTWPSSDEMVDHPH